MKSPNKFPARVRIHRLVLLLIQAVILATGCGDRVEDPQPLIPKRSAKPSAVRIDKLVVWREFRFDPAAPIAGLAFTADSQRLVMADLSYHLRTVDLNSTQVISAFRISPISLGTTVFDHSARHVAVIRGERLDVPQQNEPKSNSGLSVWDTTTGLRVADLGFYIEEDKFRSTGGIAISGNGEVVIHTAGAGVSFSDVQGRKQLSGYQRSPRMGDDYGRLCAVTFDSESTYVAEGHANGYVNVYSIDVPKLYRNHLDRYKFIAALRLPGWSTPTPTGWYEPAWQPLAIHFSPTREWLAEATREKLVILDLQRGGRVHDVMNMAVASDAAALAFDPSGKLLAHGSKNGWQLWDVENKKLLRDDKSAAVYALAFSSDGRYFATGDSNGVVRVWSTS